MASAYCKGFNNSCMIVFISLLLCMTSIEFNVHSIYMVTPEKSDYFTPHHNSLATITQTFPNKVETEFWSLILSSRGKKNSPIRTRKNLIFLKSLEKRRYVSIVNLVEWKKNAWREIDFFLLFALNCF